MTEITGEELAALSAIGRQTLSKAKATKDSQFARQAFEVYLDWLGLVNEDPDRVIYRMRDVATTFARLSPSEQNFSIQLFGTYVHTLMKATPAEGAGYIALITALRFMFKIGWSIT